MRYVITQEQLEEINTVCRNNTNPRADRRLKVLLLWAEGKTMKEIAYQTGFHLSSVGRIMALYREKGLSALAENHYAGNRRNMTREEEAAFIRAFQQKAESGQIVTPKQIKAAYEERVGHKIGGSQIYYVLKRHGWHACWLGAGDTREEN